MSKRYDETKKIYINSKLNREKNTLIIYVNFKKETNLNILNNDLKFNIILDENFPESKPIVNCLTNLIYPSLFDNRNLLSGIIKHNWSSSSRVDDIIDGIPYFIMRVNDNFYLNILVYYGEYQIDKIYSINEFFLNEDINVYRCFQYVQKKNKSSKHKRDRYIILTDIYFLLFDPLPNQKDQSKLLFWGDIRQLTNLKLTYLSEEKCDSVTLEWKNGKEVQITFELTFVDITIKDFMEISSAKVENLTKKYKMFHDDFWKYGELNSFSYENKDYLINVIKSKEKVLKESKSIFLINELITLYNKIIEILSIENDEIFKKYLNKVQNILNDKEIQAKMKEDLQFSNILLNNFGDNIQDK